MFYSQNGAPDDEDDEKFLQMIGEKEENGGYLSHRDGRAQRANKGKRYTSFFEDISEDEEYSI